MKVDVGTYTGDHRVLNKVWEIQHSYLNVRLRGEVSLTKPVVFFNASTFDVTGCNYCKLHWHENNAKYYFIDNISFDGQIVILELTEDVLQTFSTEIGNLQGNIIRQENVYNKFLPDDRIICDARRQIRPFYFNQVPFSTTGIGNPVVLTVSGGDS